MLIRVCDLTMRLGPEAVDVHVRFYYYCEFVLPGSPMGLTRSPSRGPLAALMPRVIHAVYGPAPTPKYCSKHSQVGVGLSAPRGLEWRKFVSSVHRISIGVEVFDVGSSG